MSAKSASVGAGTGGSCFWAVAVVVVAVVIGLSLPVVVVCHEGSPPGTAPRGRGDSASGVAVVERGTVATRGRLPRIEIGREAHIVIGRVRVQVLRGPLQIGRDVGTNRADGSGGCHDRSCVGLTAREESKMVDIARAPQKLLPWAGGVCSTRRPFLFPECRSLRTL